MSRSESGETTTAAALDEGARTWGVWLPLALADTVTLMFALVRTWAEDSAKIKVPRRSELLKSWALPFTGSALAAEEKEQERREKAEKAKVFKARLAAMQEKYGRSKNADQVRE